MYLADLAGSEKLKSSVNLSEVSSINNSLASLGMCIDGLVQGRDHIPIRNSKLTRILNGCFTLDSQIDLIICLKDGEEFMNESYATLQFANKLKKIALGATRNRLAAKGRDKSSSRALKENVNIGNVCEVGEGRDFKNLIMNYERRLQDLESENKTLKSELMTFKGTDHG